VAVFLVMNIVAYVVSVEPRTSLLGEPLQQVGLTTMIALAVAYAVARISVKVTARLVAFLSVAAIAGTAVALYGVVQLAGLDPVWSGLPRGRVFSSIGQPNWLAALLVMTVPITIAVAATANRSVVRYAGFVAVLLQLTVLLATRSRSGYLGLAAIAVIGMVILLRHPRRTRRTPRQLAAVGVVAALLAASPIIGLGRITPEVAPTSLAQRAMSVFDVGGFDAQRYIALWKVGAAIAADHPFTGTGQDTYAIMFPQYRDEVLDGTFADHFTAFRPESPHNAYLAIASGTGIPTLLAYVGVIVSSLAVILPRAGTMGRTRVLLIAIVAAMVLTGSWLFWALMGMGLTIAARQEDEQLAQTDEPGRP
jgi:O-antigen ligase